MKDEGKTIVNVIPYTVVTYVTAHSLSGGVFEAGWIEDPSTTTD